MARKARVQRLEFPAGRRVLVISDIHGSLPMFQGLLERASYGPEDILVLLGDLVEKGPDSLAVLRYVMDLSSRRTVYLVRGNCDDLVAEFVEAPQVRPEFFHHYLNVWRNRCTLLQMGQEAGFETRSPDDLPALRQVILDHFGPELAFLDAIPEILLTPDYLFVHGGVEDEDHLEDMEAWKCMKNDFFLEQGKTFRRWCIVGHTPVTIYHPHIPTTNPLVDEVHHIVSIDGGCALQWDAQLNALVLPQKPGEGFTWYAYDRLPTAMALDRQEETPQSVNVRWGHNQVEVLLRGGALCRCRHLESGRNVDVLTDYLYRSGGVTLCKESTDYRPAVEPGDILSIVRRLADRALVKKNGVTGWYFGRLCRPPADPRRAGL